MVPLAANERSVPPRESGPSQLYAPRTLENGAGFSPGVIGSARADRSGNGASAVRHAHRTPSSGRPAQ